MFSDNGTEFVSSFLEDEKMKIVVVENEKIYELLKESLENFDIRFSSKKEFSPLNIKDSIVLIPVELFNPEFKKDEFSIFIIISNEKDYKKSLKFLRKGAFDVVFEKSSREEIVETINNAISSYEAFIENYSVPKTLKEIGDSLVFSNSFKNSIENAISKIHRFVGGKTVLISVLKNGKEEIVAYKGEKGEALYKLYSSLKSHEWIKNLKEGINTISNDGIHKEKTYKIPLYIRKNMVGVLTVLGELPPHYRGFLINTALMISLFIENFRVYKELIKEREKELLREKQKTVQSIINSVNHEINNPLTIAMIGVETIKNKIEDRDKDKLLNKVTKIEKALERIKSIVERIDVMYSESYIKNYKKNKSFTPAYEN